MLFQNSARNAETHVLSNWIPRATVISALLLAIPAFGQQDVGTAFTYQGNLENGSGPVTDTCDFRFGLWNDATAGAQSGVSPQTVALVDVVAGSFTVALDFGVGAINGDARWLEIEVQCPGDAGFVLLAPRVELTPAPHALRASTGVGPPAALEVDSVNGRIGIGTNIPTQPLHVVGTVMAQNPGTSPDGSTVRFGGPSGDPGLVIQKGDGIGGVSRQWEAVIEHDNTLEIRDNTAGGLERLMIDTTGRVGIGTTTPGEQLTVAGAVHSTSGGFKFPDGTTQTTAAAGGGTGSTLDGAYDQGGPGAGRIITADSGAVEIQGPDGLHVAGAIQSGNSIVIDGTDYTVTSDNDLDFHVGSGRALRMEPNGASPILIGGYSGNTVTFGASGATISGGGSNANLNLVTDAYGTVGGGRDNQAGDAAGSSSDRWHATVGGGAGNTASGAYSTVGGGNNNTATGTYAAVAGGIVNDATGTHSAIGGGANSTASGTYSAVGGGNTNAASGSRSTVPGGSSNTAGGDNSLAAGNRAKVRSSAQVGGGDTDGDQGTFVWADSTNTDFTSSGPDQFLIRASGGVGIGTNTPGEQLTVAGTIHSTTGGFKFPDGSTQTTAATSGSTIPVGSGVLRVSASPISGFTHYGETLYLATDRWTNEVASPFPTGIFGAMVAKNSSHVSIVLYSIGGFTAPNSLAGTTVLRLANGIWESRAPLPDRRGFAGIASDGPRLYVLGGTESDTLASDSATYNLFQYDSNTNTWTSLTNSPQSAWALGATIIGDYLYQIGGFEWSNETFGHVPIAPVHRFDIRNSTWGQVADIPTPRGFLGVASANGLLYAIGGRQSYNSQPTDIVEIYDPVSNTWREGTPMPIPAADFAIAVVDDRVYCIGGISGNRYGSLASATGLRTVQEYDTTRDQWALRAPLPTPRGASSAVTIGTEIWVLHGLESHVCPVDSPCNTEITNSVDGYQSGRELFIHYKD